MTECDNCGERIVRLSPLGWCHPEDDYNVRCVVEGPFRGLVATPA
ncbi:hypothetical protein SEA_LILMAC1015_66 [Arthrobacter phage Lilmac1015]|uniref:Uncharacterized protein n=2 Tax=Lilmacvirus TaxID=3425005 RepID=A0AAE9BS47_9CAUD|nr:hypothetical protein SEA_KLEVEY_65 [Arthrobacter phage Klevey]UKH48352.1 hypothetical protein SEA_LILMAC1015_66 [Arthrobacter phage Lilmac1015]